MYIPRLYKIAKKDKKTEDKKGLRPPNSTLVKSFIKDNNLLLKAAGIGAGIGAVGGGTVGVVIELLKALGRRMGGLRDNNIAPLILAGLLKGGFIGAGFGGLAGFAYPSIKSVKKVKGLVDGILKSPGYKTLKDALANDLPKNMLKEVTDIGTLATKSLEQSVINSLNSKRQIDNVTKQLLDFIQVMKQQKLLNKPGSQPKKEAVNGSLPSFEEEL